MTPLLLALGWTVAIALLFDWLVRPGAAPALRRPRLAAMEGWLRRAGVRDVGPWQFLAASLTVGLGAGLIAQLWQGFPALSLVVAGVGALMPAVYYRLQERRRQDGLEEALVEAMRQLRDSVRAGLALSEAFGGLSRTGPLRLRGEFALLNRQAAYDGFTPALEALRDRLASPLGDLLCASLLLSERVGGRNLGGVLERLARAAREQRRVRREAAAAQAGQVFAITLAACVPAIVFAGMHQTNPAYLDFFATPLGELILGACALAMAAAYAAMLHLGRLPAEPRVLLPEQEGGERP